MKRLKKAMMDIDVFKGAITQLSDQGRSVLKSIEELKFKLEQTSRIVSNDQKLTNQIIQKRKILDSVSGQIYGVIFDLENLDITDIYQDQQININNTNMENSKPENQTNIQPEKSDVEKQVVDEKSKTENAEETQNTDENAESAEDEDKINIEEDEEEEPIDDEEE